ncbi:polyhydroxyalkanoate synthesis regulator DNA-binding domain-containing protein [Nocardia goodfellowii]
MTASASSPAAGKGKRRSGVGYLTLRRERDGRLYNHDRHKWIGLAELADDVRAGSRFRVYQERDGSDCTADVLIELVTSALNRFASNVPPP